MFYNALWQQFWIFGLLLTVCFQRTSAGTKELYKLRTIIPQHSLRNEVGILNTTDSGEEEFIVKGTRITYFYDTKSDQPIRKEITYYLADKKGYRVVYKYSTPGTDDNDETDIRLDSQTLKSLGG